MQMKDISIGMRITTAIGDGVVTGFTGKKYVDLLMDKSIRGRKDMTDRTHQMGPRSLKPVNQNLGPIKQLTDALWDAKCAIETLSDSYQDPESYVGEKYKNICTALQSAGRNR